MYTPKYKYHPFSNTCLKTLKSFEEKQDKHSLIHVKQFVRAIRHRDASYLTVILPDLSWVEHNCTMSVVIFLEWPHENPQPPSCLSIELLWAKKNIRKRTASGKKTQFWSFGCGTKPRYIQIPWWKKLPKMPKSYVLWSSIVKLQCPWLWYHHDTMGVRELDGNNDPSFHRGVTNPSNWTMA